MTTVMLGDGVCELRDVKKGAFVRLSDTTEKTYIKGDYDRASKRFSLIDCDDMNHERFVKADKIVYTDFTY